MTIDPVRDALQAKPFQPFRLQLADVTVVQVTHPESVAFHPRSPRNIVIATPTGGFKTVELLLVAALHVGNGRRKNGRGWRA